MTLEPFRELLIITILFIDIYKYRSLWNVEAKESLLTVHVSFSSVSFKLLVC